MKILAKEARVFVPMTVPCVWRKLSPLKWNECSFRSHPSICLRATLGIFVPSSCGLFVYKLGTSIDTKIVYWPIFVFSVKVITSVVSLIKVVLTLFLIMFKSL